MKSLTSEFNARRLIYLNDLFRELVARDFKLRYKRSLLGIFWSLLVPLAQLLILYFVFTVVLPINIPHYLTFLFTGLLPWTWFQGGLSAASGAIVENRELVKQVGFPAAILPVITVTSHLIHFLLAFPILAVFLLIEGYIPNSALLALPLVIILQFVLTVSLGYLVATFQVSFHDTQYLLGIALLLLFYLTPVFYDVHNVPAKYQTLYHLNPLVHIIGAYRTVLIEREWPDFLPLLVLSVISAGLFSFSYMVFMRAHYRFVEEL